MSSCRCGPKSASERCSERISPGPKTHQIRVSLEVEGGGDEERAKSLGFKHGPFHYLEKDYVLLSVAEAEEQNV
jgi:hypothetical protein